MQILRVEITVAAILSHAFMGKVMIYMVYVHMSVYMHIYFSNQEHNHSFTSLEK